MPHCPQFAAVTLCRRRHLRQRPSWTPRASAAGIMPCSSTSCTIPWGRMPSTHVEVSSVTASRTGLPRRAAIAAQWAIMPVRSSSTERAWQACSVPLMVRLPVPSGRTVAVSRGQSATRSCWGRAWERITVRVRPPHRLPARRAVSLVGGTHIEVPRRPSQDHEGW